VDSGTTTTRAEAARVIRAGFFGDADEVRLAEETLAVVLSDLDQLDAAVDRYKMMYGEAVADPLTELRLRLQRGE
jgi:hypothetical protein